MIQRYVPWITGEGFAFMKATDSSFQKNAHYVSYSDHLAVLSDLQQENRKLRGQDQCVYWHGTNPASAEIIKQEGFREGTYFARHMEDAATFGGPIIFQVKVHFERPSPDGWQIVCANALPASSIEKIYDLSAQAALSTEAEKVRKLREALQNIADYPATQEGQDDWEEIEKGWELLADAARIALKETGN